MGSIAGEGAGVNLKAVFAGALKDAQQEMVRRVGEAVGQELDGAVKRMLGRDAYVRRERVAPWVEMAGGVIAARVGRVSDSAVMGIGSIGC